VDETIEAMESEMQCKIRKGGLEEDRRTGELLYSKFFHRDSRPIDGLSDPHWHGHCFLHNATFDSVEKRWKAGQFRDLIADKGYFQEYFHTLLVQLDTSHLTTEQAKREEEQLLALVRGGWDTCEALRPAIELDWLKLTEEQRKALEHVLTSRDLVMDVSGIAGAGKSHHFLAVPVTAYLETAIDDSKKYVWRASGFEILAS
jgi:TrwC relaxase